MSATPGYYADPAGSDELRYFDGAQWAATTTPAPSTALAAPPIPPSAPAPAPPAAVPAPAFAPDAWTRPAVGSRAAAIHGDSQRTAGRQSPGLRSAGTPVVGEPFYRRPRVLAAVAGVAAVAVLGAVFLPGLLSSKSESPASVAPAAKAPVTEHHLVLHTPASVNGWPKSTDLTSVGGVAGARRALDGLTTQQAVALYREPGTDNGAFVMVGDAYVPPARRAALLRQLVSGFTQAGWTFTTASAGAYGGLTSCGTIVEGQQRGSMCAFADDYAFGLIGLFGPGSSGVLDVMKVRERVEQVAAGPAPETGSSTGGLYAKRDAQTISKSVLSYYVDGTGPLAATTDIDRWVLTTSDDATFDSGTLSAGDSLDASTYIRSTNDWCVAVSNTDRSVWNVSSANGLLKGACTASTVGGDSTAGRDGEPA